MTKGGGGSKISKKLMKSFMNDMAKIWLLVDIWNSYCEHINIVGWGILCNYLLDIKIRNSIFGLLQRYLHIQFETRQTCFPCVFNRKDHYHLHLTKRLWRNVKFLYGSWWLVPQPSSFHDPKTIVVLSCVESAFWALHHKFWTMISGEIFGKMFINFDAAVKDTTIKFPRKILFGFY